MAGAGFPTLTNLNLEYTTRNLWKHTIRDQVLMQNPLLAKLFLAKKVAWKGGKSITQPMAIADMKSLVQNYSMGTPLTSGRKTLLSNVYFGWKWKTLPVVITAEELLQNAGDSETAPVDYAVFLNKRAQAAIREDLRDDAYGAVEIGADTTERFQSIRQALDHDCTYGHLTRATTVTNKWWQSASIDETWSDQDTAVACSIDHFDKSMDAIHRYGTDEPRNLMLVVGESLYRSLRSWCRAKSIAVNPGPLTKFFYQSFMLDNVEVVADPVLRTSQITNAHLWWFLLDVNTWELRVHPKRSFLFTGFTDQTQFTNGADELLARIFLLGNLVCWQPNANLWRSNVTS